MAKCNDWPMMSATLRDLHGAWRECTQRERAEFMEAVGLRDKEKRDAAQEENTGSL